MPTLKRSEPDYKRNRIVDYNSFINKYKKSDWERIGSWKVPNLGFSIFEIAQAKDFYKYYNLDKEPIRYLRIGPEGFISKKEKEGLHNHFKKLLLDGNLAFFNSLIKKQKTLIKKINSAKIKDKGSLFTYLHDLVLLATPFEIDRVLNEVFEEVITLRLKELGKEDINIMSLLSGKGNSDTENFNGEIGKLAEKIKRRDYIAEDRYVQDKVGKLQKKYCYLGFYLFSGNEYTKEDILGLIKKRAIGEKSRSKTEELPAIRDKRLKKIIDLTNIFSENRMMRVESLNKALLRLVPILRDEAKEQDIRYEDILELQFNDLVESLKGNKKLAITSYDSTAIISGPENIILDPKYFKRLKEGLHNLLSPKYEQQVKGVSAFKGKVKGTARIVIGHSDFSKMKEGDVLICSMTDPNFIPIMHKCSAIVTDKGGILCHAAIVAREMNKPCVIGTKIATKIFKDGGFVEVDADKGIVRKIK